MERATCVVLEGDDGRWERANEGVRGEIWAADHREERSTCSFPFLLSCEVHLPVECKPVEPVNSQ